MRLIYSILFIATIASGDITNLLDEAYSRVKQESIRLYAGDMDDNITQKEKRLNEVWNRVLPEYDEGVMLLSHSIDAPDSAWFEKDRLDYERDIQDVLNNIMKSITDQDIMMYREKISEIKSEIKELKSDISRYREKRVGAPVASLVYTTKIGYDTRIKNSSDKVAMLENDIAQIKSRLTKDFAKNGIILNASQIDVLLTRVDGDDIIRMAVVVDTLNQITPQILQLMRESKEDLTQAKRYYAMNLISWKLLLYMQRSYIDRVDNIFIPKIEHIIAQADSMRVETSRLYEDERDSQKREIYSKNMQTQIGTRDIATSYKSQLLLSKQKMQKAMSATISNLKLVENTYKTVSLSSELYRVITQSQEMFSKIAKIQMPEIVPFENLEVKRKYQEITGRILEDRF